MYVTVEFQNERQNINDFLALPKMLYGKYELTQNTEEERKIIEGTHVLNKYFRQRKLLAYGRGGNVCGRCVVTIYPDTDNAYIGYFECIDDAECASALFKAAEGCVRQCGLQKITGPLDSSFWLKYRLKINGFDKPPYTGEPYNKPYYAKMFEDNGYRVAKRWVSNMYARPPLFSRVNSIYRERLNLSKSRKYKIINVSPGGFDKAIDIIYGLISESFKSFTAFHAVSRDDFREIFKNYRYILDYRFVKIVYYGGEPVAFSITLPDYGNLLTWDLTLSIKIRILLKRLRSGNYVSLYMGAKRKHYGLGKALTQKIIRDIYIRRARCIGALIAEGAFTENYVDELIVRKNEYVLFEKNLGDKK